MGSDCFSYKLNTAGTKKVKNANIRIRKSYSNIRMECEYSNVQIFVDILTVNSDKQVNVQKAITNIGRLYGIHAFYHNLNCASSFKVL